MNKALEYLRGQLSIAEGQLNPNLSDTQRSVVENRIAALTRQINDAENSVRPEQDNK